MMKVRDFAVSAMAFAVVLVFIGTVSNLAMAAMGSIGLSWIHGLFIGYLLYSPSLQVFKALLEQAEVLCGGTPEALRKSEFKPGGYIPNPNGDL